MPVISKGCPRKLRYFGCYNKAINDTAADKIVAYMSMHKNHYKYFLLPLFFLLRFKEKKWFTFFYLYQFIIFIIIIIIINVNIIIINDTDDVFLDIFNSEQNW